jgi:hypothetical protein
VRTGDQRFDDLFDLEWAIYRQLLDWDTGTNNLKTSVTWSGTNPVKCCDLLKATDSIFDERTNKNLKGWRAVWVGQTDLWFPHDTVIA